jgi:hypothetical protein
MQPDNRVMSVINAIRQNWQRGLLLISAFALVTVLVAAPNGIAVAQTPVPINVDTNALMSQVNTWINALDETVFLGLAISIAITILLFIGSIILRGFQQARS